MMRTAGLIGRTAELRDGPDPEADDPGKGSRCRGRDEVRSREMRSIFRLKPRVSLANPDEPGAN